MVLGKLRGRSAKAEAQAPQASAASGLGAVLKQGITLQPERVAMLKEAFTEGLEFFESFNESRLILAFGSFDEPIQNLPSGIKTSTTPMSSPSTSSPASLRSGSSPVTRCQNSHRPDSGSGPIGTKPT